MIPDTELIAQKKEKIKNLLSEISDRIEEEDFFTALSLLKKVERLCKECCYAQPMAYPNFGPRDPHYKEEK